MQQLSMDVFPDGRTLAYVQRSNQGVFDIFQVSSSSGAEPIPLVVSRADKNDMRLSPDGRAMAFIAFDGTRTDLYVAPVPVTTAPVLAAGDVGSVARWGREGRRLFYVDNASRMMSVAVRTAPALEVGAPQPLFQLKRPGWLADVAGDGRFLLMVPLARADQRPITVATGAIPTP